MNAPWRILVVDDEDHIAQNNATALNRASGSDPLPYPVEAFPTTSFTDALDRVGRGDVDLLVLDVFDQAGAQDNTDVTDLEPVGRSVFEKVREQRFLPIIFLTALPDRVEYGENPPFVQIVSKGAPNPFEALFAGVKRCLDSPFPELYRAVRSHIENASRQFMIGFVEPNWNELEARPRDVEHLLMRRLGVSFDTTQNDRSAGSVPAIRYYIVPAPSEHRTGDIVTKSDAADANGQPETQWHVVMTPSCDLVEGREKADYVVLAECIPLPSFKEHKDWISAESNNKRKSLERLVKSKDRYFYLPAAWKVPDLMVDLQRITSIPHADLSLYAKQASLDDPYAAQLSHQFHCYLGAGRHPGSGSERRDRWDAIHTAVEESARLPGHGDARRWRPGRWFLCWRSGGLAVETIHAGVRWDTGSRVRWSWI